MKNSTRKLLLLITSLFLALCFDLLFYGVQPGISFVIFVALGLSASLIFSAKKFRVNWLNVSLVVLILGFSAMFSISDNGFLMFLNFCASFGLFVLLMEQMHGYSIRNFTFFDYFFRIVAMPLRMLHSALINLRSLDHNQITSKHKNTAKRATVGLILSLPVLFIFGLLFSSADVAFQTFFSGLSFFDLPTEFTGHLVMVLFAFLGSFVILSYLFVPRDKSETQPKLADDELKIRSDIGVEVGVFLGAIATLFFVFIIFQFTYLFGGSNNIGETGLTYAEYARRGFWELLLVSFLTLGLLLTIEKFVIKDRVKYLPFLVPTLVVVLEVFIIIISSYKRLALYIDTYGMTSLRFYVMAFIFLLFATFVLMGAKLLFEKSESFFTFGSLSLLVVFMVCVNISNPDKYILSKNLQRYESIGKIDLIYNSGLSADATRQKIILLDKMNGEDKLFLQNELISEAQSLRSIQEDWQSWNLSRAKALRMLGEY